MGCNGGFVKRLVNLRLKRPRHNPFCSSTLHIQEIAMALQAHSVTLSESFVVGCFVVKKKKYWSEVVHSVYGPVK